MQIKHLIGIGAVLAWTGLANAQAQQPCCDERSAASRQYLGQGVALFDGKNYKEAERALHAALFVGLPDLAERVLAHKYLAFTYCSNGETARCTAAFDEAFALQPAFALAEHESRNAVWRAAYLRAQTRRGGPPAVARETQPPSASKTASKTAAHDPQSDSNVRLRVAPWATVQVNGKQVGVTPPVTRLQLPPGLHTVRLSNPGFTPVRQVIKVTKGQTVTISHDFESR
ncbi:PEGA domain-containing protein [Pseudorhodoferax sp.]|uniref:PEGA domain-containing protein n=1 Tax=Pseudorhodoferax sp. TaxID=1993553 RepID=UPI002DD6873F|nr:PEGA domain-containing protein [Pseudorhodoferax sp.]